jgi:hypothetical protein
MSEFRRIYPKTGRILLDGGKNSKFERSIIEDNESPDCANVIFTNGAVETREGAQKLNTTAIGSFVFDGLYTRRTNSGSETMVAFAGGSAWQLAGTTFSTLSSAQSVFTVGARVAAAQYENHMFIGNGGVIPYKYNGTDFTRHGVYPPTTTHSVATGAAGNPNGAYQYKITYVNSQSVESDVGPVNATITVASTKVELTGIPVAPQSWGVSSRYIYRTADGGTSFKRVTELADNTTTTYSDDTADASLGTTAPTDNGVPPKYSTIVYHQNRLFMNDPANPNMVWYSGLGEPYTVASTNFISIGDATSDLVKALSVYDNSILVKCEKSEWLIYMPDTDSSNWNVVRVKSPYGSKSPFCLLDYNNRQIYAAVENGKFVGFAAIAGDSVEPSATLLTVSTAGSLLKSDRIEPDMFLVQETYLGNISGIIYQNRAYIAVTHGSGTTTNNRIWVMDFSISNLSKNQKESWVPWTGLSAAQFTIYDGDLYYGSSTANGFVYQLESGEYNDDGSAINSYFWTKEFSGYPNEVNYHKDFRYANILVEKPGAYYMNVTYRVDSDAGDGDTETIDLTPGGSLWGVMEWGTDSWGGGVDQEDVRFDLGTARGKRIQFKFSNQNAADQRFKVHGLNYAYNLKGLR